MNQKFNYTKWLPFDEIYRFDEGANNRRALFIPKNNIITDPVAGIYLIADDSVGPLDSPESVIYIGKTVGNDHPSSFHERLWKHCCKAKGECGGKYCSENGKFERDRTDNTEPKDTKNWASYRHNKFKSFSNWHFSFFRLGEMEFDLAREQISLIEDITMYAFSYYSNPKKALCNGSPPQSAVKFPWMWKKTI